MRRFTTGKYFLDTNFLLYCFSGDEKDKKKKCAQILDQGEKGSVFVISTQVINEFGAVMIKKFGVHPLLVKQVLANLDIFEIIDTDISLISEAIDIHVLAKYSFWDSLILAAAKRAKCSMVLSEGFHHGQSLFGLKIFNPFLD